ncbi:MAG: YciI family protein [Burkholderiales bacterium]|nr:YciI family protein [Burkholderiales bacterium]
MRFMVMVKATKDSESGAMPDQKLIEDMGRFNEELVNAGIMQAGEGLQPSTKGARIKFSRDNKRTVVDGPFTETKELVAGFWIWKCKSRDEAIAWAKRSPSPFPGQECEIEVRQIMEAEDFGAEFTPEAREHEERLRARVEANK